MPWLLSRPSLSLGFAVVLSGVGLLGSASGKPLIFVTSVNGTGELSTWPDAGGERGLRAADVICAARASAAGLPAAESFVAWLSDSSDDAYCRLHRLPGKKKENCGLSELPAAGGPWTRVDGLPFAHDVGGLVSGEILTPLRIDEFGQTLDPDVTYTATFADGSLNDLRGTCSDWSAFNAFDSVGSGSLDHTTQAWTELGFRFCLLESRLICIQASQGPPLPVLPRSTSRLAFVTADVGTGDLSSWPGADGAQGVAAGDAVCRARASAAGLHNASAYKAWLSASPQLPEERFTFDGPWRRLDGILIAEDLVTLTGPRIPAPLNLTESLSYLDRQSSAWAGEGCQDWTNASSGMGNTGDLPAANRRWQFGGQLPCGELHHLYCFADIEFEIFFDGFETGDTTRWSQSVGR